MGVEIIVVRGRKWGPVLGVLGTVLGVVSGSLFRLRFEVEMGSEFGGLGGTFWGPRGQVLGVPGVGFEVGRILSLFWGVSLAGCNL
jgi:hypothetical protein